MAKKKAVAENERKAMPRMQRHSVPDADEWHGQAVRRLSALRGDLEDGRGRLLRLLHTDEWYPLMFKPAWHDALMEYRTELLERLTAPAPFAGGAPPKAT
jgi:hypothetical protein